MSNSGLASASPGLDSSPPTTLSSHPAFKLNQNYPNPFNPATHIEYALPSAERVLLRVYDLIGNEVRTLVDGVRPAGQYAVTWDGANHVGQRVAAGIYFYRLHAGAFQQTRKMLVTP